MTESKISAEMVKGAREMQGITQEKAAEILGVSVRAWQYWEAGQRRMHPAFWELFVRKVFSDFSPLL